MDKPVEKKPAVARKTAAANKTAIVKTEAPAKKATPATAAKTTDYITHVPSCDVIEQPRSVRIVMDMPGVEPDAVTIDVKDRLLKVCANSPFVWHGRAISYCRSFQLSDDIDCKGITAKVRHGVLELKLPKLESAKVHKIKVVKS